jgi:hypothetical protein
VFSTAIKITMESKSLHSVSAGKHPVAVARTYANICWLAVLI